MASRNDRIKDVAQRYVDLGAYASLEWLVVLDGHEWMRGRAGMADPLNGIALPDKPIYRLYSMTKPVISAIALMLMEEGKLRLYDPVAAFLPAFAKPQIIDESGALSDARRVMLVEHLLTHRSGLSYGFLPDCPAAERYRETDLRRTHGPLADMIDTIAGLPLAFEPGSKWRYSVATDVVARIIEVIEKKPLQQVVAERIIEPLGLADTGFMVPPDKRDRVMPVFGNTNLDGIMEFPEEQELTPAEVDEHYPVDDPGFARGGYGLFSTADDYAIIADFLATGTNRDGDVMLSRNMIAMMWTDRIPESQQPLAIGPVPLPGYGFSLAGRVMTNLKRRVSLTGEGEFGWSGAAGTFYWTDPAENLTGIIMTQYLGSKYPMADDMRNAVYQALE